VQKFNKPEAEVKGQL